MKDPQGCGLLVDCPADYSLEEVNISAARWDDSNASHTALLAARHSAARSACEHTRAARLRSGGWCLAALKPGGLGVRSVDLPGGHDYLVADPHTQADAIIVDVLLQLLKPKADGSRASVLDLGAGIGQYGHALLSADSRVAWRGYDGAGNVEEATRSFVRFVDLTVPLSLPRAAACRDVAAELAPCDSRRPATCAHAAPLGAPPGGDPLGAGLLGAPKDLRHRRRPPAGGPQRSGGQGPLGAPEQS